jgi:endonuclease III
MPKKNTDPSRTIAEITQLLEKHFGEPVRRQGADFLEDLIWTLLSQNTNDRNAETAYKRLRERFPDWPSIADARTSSIEAAIRPAGLGQQKATHIKSILKWVRDTFGCFDLNFLCSRPPDEVRDMFLALKGIGVKTISVTLMATCGHNVFPVDTHVHRICHRLHLVPLTASAEKTHWLMQPLIPDGKAYSLHINMLRLGRTICMARKPSCSVCPLYKRCPSAITDTE